MVGLVLYMASFCSGVVDNAPAAQRSAGTAELAGLVVESSTLGRIDNVKVTVDSLHIVYTDSTGLFEFDDLSPGKHVLIAADADQ